MPHNFCLFFHFHVITALVTSTIIRTKFITSYIASEKVRS